MASTAPAHIFCARAVSSRCSVFLAPISLARRCEVLMAVGSRSTSSVVTCGASAVRSATPAKNLAARAAAPDASAPSFSVTVAKAFRTCSLFTSRPTPRASDSSSSRRAIMPAATSTRPSAAPCRRSASAR
jgi:hypothetical protein